MNYYEEDRKTIMDTIDITITKNKLQILILQAQENIKKQATNSKKRSIRYINRCIFYYMLFASCIG